MGVIGLLDVDVEVDMDDFRVNAVDDDVDDDFRVFDVLLDLDVSLASFSSFLL